MSPQGHTSQQPASMAAPRPGFKPGYSGRPGAAIQALDMLKVAEQLRRTLGLSPSMESPRYDTYSTAADEYSPPITVQRSFSGLNSAREKEGTSAQTGLSGSSPEAADQGLRPRDPQVTQPWAAASAMREAVSPESCTEQTVQKSAYLDDGSDSDELAEGVTTSTSSSMTDGRQLHGYEIASPVQAASGVVAAASISATVDSSAAVAAAAAVTASAAAAQEIDMRIQSLERHLRESAQEQVQIFLLILISTLVPVCITCSQFLVQQIPPSKREDIDRHNIFFIDRECETIPYMYWQKIHKLRSCEIPSAAYPEACVTMTSTTHIALNHSVTTHNYCAGVNRREADGSAGS